MFSLIFKIIGLIVVLSLLVSTNIYIRYITAAIILIIGILWLIRFGADIYWDFFSPKR